MKRIAIYNTSLQMGGISKSLICFLSAMQFKNYEFDLYLFKNKNEHEVDVNYKNLNINIIKVNPILARWASIIPFSILMRLNYKNISSKRYDYVIDYNGYNNLCAALALKTKSLKHVIWVHNDYYMRYKYNVKFRILWNLSKRKFSKFDEIVAVSQGALEGFKEKYRGTIKSTKIIPNLVDVEDIIEKSRIDVDIETNDKYCVVSVANLCKAKQVDRQIEIMKEVKSKREDICLYVIGEGKERKHLERMVKKNHLEKDVIFLGRQVNPYKYMSKMDGLIFTSAYEGQGIVVREAQVLGLDLFIESQLKDYNEGIDVSEDLTNDLVMATKKEEKKINQLLDYLSDIEAGIEQLLG